MLWNASFYYSNLIKPINGTCYTYILTEPSLLGWMPIRTRAELVPSNRPDDRMLGFVAWSHMGMAVFNAYGVARVSFPANVPFVSEYARAV